MGRAQHPSLRNIPQDSGVELETARDTEPRASPETPPHSTVSSTRDNVIK